MSTPINSLVELRQALAANQPQTLELQAAILSPHPLVLPPGYALVGTDPARSSLSFSHGDGLGLTADNRVENLVVLAPPSGRAIYSLAGTADMGTLTLRNLTVVGQVALLLWPGTQRLRVEADQVDVVACDARFSNERPQKYGVSVLPGAFTVYNLSSDAGSQLTASLTAISAGRPNAPVFGSGVLVSGFGDAGGQVQLPLLTTGAVHSTGLLAEGTASLITGGVFVVYGTRADTVTNLAEVVTYGVNDMVLDNWGQVGSWTATAPLTSRGPSGIGFVNFGTVDTFEAQQPITTYGRGARGFNQYDGTVQHARFHSITTHGDGAIGVQISKPVGTIEVQQGITTHGAVGDTLVKGVVEQLPADAFSVKPGGEVQHLLIGTDLTTHGAGATTYALDEGTVRDLRVGGRIAATGADATAISLRNGGSTPLTNVAASAPQGQVLRNDGGTVTDQAGFRAVG